MDKLLNKTEITDKIEERNMDKDTDKEQETEREKRAKEEMARQQTFSQKPRVMRTPVKTSGETPTPTPSEKSGGGLFKEGSWETLVVSSDDESSKERQVKRKREQLSPQERLQRQGKGTREKLEKALAGLGEQAERLQGLIREHPNTQKNIKAAIKEIGRVYGMITKIREQGGMEDCVENRNRRREDDTQDTEAQKKTTKDMGTQTEPWHKAVTRVKPREIDSYDKFRDMTSTFGEEEYTSTRVEIGNPMEKGLDTQVVVVEEDDKEMSRSIQGIYARTHPELLEAEDFDVIEISSRTRKGPRRERRIVKATIENGKDKGQALWDLLERVAAETVENTEISLHRLRSTGLRALRDMAECVFARQSTAVRIFTDRMENNAKEKSTYSVIVGKQGSDYRDVLKSIRDGVKEKEISGAISDIRKTAEGKALVTLRKDPVALKEFQSAMDKGDGVSMILTGSNVWTLSIKGMDALTTKDEVIEAVAKECGGKGHILGASKLRPNARETQAITVSMTAEKAADVCRLQRIRVGLVNCSVERRLEVASCNRCGSYDHLSQSCSLPPGGGGCYKCGKQGHVAKACESEQLHCVACKEDGHKRGSFKCPAFRRALGLLRKEERERMRGGRSPPG